MARAAEQEPPKKPVAPPPAPDPLLATLGTEAVKEETQPLVNSEKNGKKTKGGTSADTKDSQAPATPDNNVAPVPIPSRPAVGDTDGLNLLALPSRKEEPVEEQVNQVTKDQASTKPNFGEEVLARRQNIGNAPLMYKDALPKRVVSSISNGLVSEQLARLLLKIKEEDNMEKLIFKDEFVAVPWELFTGTVANPPNFLAALGEAGYLYFDAAHSGKKVHDLPVSEGSKTKIRCFLMAKNLAVALELMKK